MRRAHWIESMDEKAAIARLEADLAAMENSEKQKQIILDEILLRACTENAEQVARFALSRCAMADAFPPFCSLICLFTH